MYPRAKTALIERAHAVAEQAHEGQLRKSGEPYITHPIAVAEIIAGLGLPDTVIVAALLHDVVEDTNFPLEEIAAEFGDEVASFVDGVTKARPADVWRRRPGGDRAQAGRGHGAGHSRAAAQARRPPAQRAHVGRGVARVRPTQGPGDARDLRAARAPHGPQRDQVGARGPVVQDALPEDLPRDRRGGGGARARAREAARRGAQGRSQASSRTRRSRRRSRVDPSTTTPSTRR